MNVRLLMLGYKQQSVIKKRSLWNKKKKKYNKITFREGKILTAFEAIKKIKEITNKNH